MDSMLLLRTGRAAFLIKADVFESLAFFIGIAQPLPQEIFFTDAWTLTDDIREGHALSQIHLTIPAVEALMFGMIFR